jgi:hypothetical protein
MPTAAVEDACSTALRMKRLHVGLDAFYARGYLSTWSVGIPIVNLLNRYLT